jgi:hypothetical protein
VGFVRWHVWLVWFFGVGGGEVLMIGKSEWILATL